MKVWIPLALAGIGSYLLRVSMLIVAARSGTPPLVERAARVAVPAAFSALAAASLASSVTADASAIPALGAVAVAVAAARKTGSPPMALLMGMPTVWILSALVPG